MSLCVKHQYSINVINDSSSFTQTVIHQVTAATHRKNVPVICRQHNTETGGVRITFTALISHNWSFHSKCFHTINCNGTDNAAHSHEQQIHKRNKKNNKLQHKQTVPGFKTPTRKTESTMTCKTAPRVHVHNSGSRLNSHLDLALHFYHHRRPGQTMPAVSNTNPYHPSRTMVLIYIQFTELWKVFIVVVAKTD